jgi:hypothetical protein
MLRRSKGAPLYMIIENRAGVNLRDESLEAITMQKDRICKLRVFAHQGPVDRHEYLFSLRFPNLTGGSVSSDSGPLPDNFLSLDTPRLRDLTITGFSFDWEKLTGGSNVQNLVRFEVGKLPEGLTVTLGQVFGALERMPLLEELALGCTNHFPGYRRKDTLSSTSRSISLDHLELLVLIDTVRNVGKMLYSGIRLPPAPLFRLGIILDDDRTSYRGDVPDAVAWLARHLAPAAEAGQIDRLVYERERIEIYINLRPGVRHTLAWVCWLPSNKVEDSLRSWVLRHLPLQGIRFFKLVLPAHVPASAFPLTEQFVAGCPRLAKLNVGRLPASKLVSVLVPGQDGVPVPTLSHLRISRACLVGKNGRRSTEYRALCDALIRRRDALGSVLSASISRSVINTEMIQELRDIVGESNLE